MSKFFTTTIDGSDVRYVIHDDISYALFTDVYKALGLKEHSSRKALMRAGFAFNFPHVLAREGVMYLLTNHYGVEMLKSKAEKMKKLEQLTQDVPAREPSFGDQYRPDFLKMAQEAAETAKLQAKAENDEWKRLRAIERAARKNAIVPAQPVPAPIQPVTMSNVLSNMFQGHEIRTAIKDDGSIWFVLNDVCGALGIENASDVARRLRDNQKGGVDIIDPLGGKQVNTIISESGLYSVILKSRSPRAEPFQEWIEDRVLPSIRKTGGYTETSMVPQDYEQAVEALLVSLKAAKRLEHERSLAVLQIEADRPKVEYFDEVLDASNGIEVTTIAQRYGLSAFALNKILEEHGVQYRMPHAPDSPWILHSKYKGQGLEVMKTIHVGYGLTRQVLTWTEKGRHFIHQIMQERGY